MGCGSPLCHGTPRDIKVMASVKAALLFAVIASPALYNLVQQLLGWLVTVAVNGRPTLAGLLLHSVVYGLVVYFLMYRKQNKKYAPVYGSY